MGSDSDESTVPDSSGIVICTRTVTRTVTRKVTRAVTRTVTRAVTRTVTHAAARAATQRWGAVPGGKPA